MRAQIPNRLPERVDPQSVDPQSVGPPPAYQGSFAARVYYAAKSNYQNNYLSGRSGKVIRKLIPAATDPVIF